MDAFGDNLFSVFDEEEQTTTTKNVPASLTTDIGYVGLVLEMVYIWYLGLKVVSGCVGGAQKYYRVWLCLTVLNV